LIHPTAPVPEASWSKPAQPPVPAALAEGDAGKIQAAPDQETEVRDMSPRKKKRRKSKAKKFGEERNIQSDAKAPGLVQVGHDEESGKPAKPQDEPAEKSVAKEDQRPSKPTVYGLDDAAAQTIAPESELDVSILKNRPAKAEDELTHGDTIYIDNEGNLKLMDAEQEDKGQSEKEAAHKEK
jgi:hypothetical protein